MASRVRQLKNSVTVVPWSRGRGNLQIHWLFFICQSISGHLLQGVWFVLRQVLGTWVQNDSGLHAPNQSVSGLVTSHIGCTWWQREIIAERFTNLTISLTDLQILVLVCKNNLWWSECLGFLVQQTVWFLFTIYKYIAIEYKYIAIEYAGLLFHF